VPRLSHHRNYASRWTDEDVALVVASLKEGRTNAEIAKMTGRSQEAVRSKAWANGLLPSRKKEV
jgi:hypothetical protein